MFNAFGHSQVPSSHVMNFGAVHFLQARFLPILCHVIHARMQRLSTGCLSSWWPSDWSYPDSMYKKGMKQLAGHEISTTVLREREQALCVGKQWRGYLSVRWCGTCSSSGDRLNWREAVWRRVARMSLADVPRTVNRGKHSAHGEQVLVTCPHHVDQVRLRRDNRRVSSFWPKKSWVFEDFVKFYV